MAAGHRAVFAAGAVLYALIALVSWFGLRARPDGEAESFPIGTGGTESDYRLSGSLH